MTTTPHGTWTVLSGGRRGSLTASEAALAVVLGDETLQFPRSDDLELDFPTPYSVRIVERGEVRLALGFASTAEAQDFRRAVLPPQAQAPGEATMVMRPVATRRLSVQERLQRLFVVGLVVQLVGWLFVVALREEPLAVGFGALLLGAGGIPVLATVVAWGVKTGIEASRRADSD